MSHHQNSRHAGFVASGPLTLPTTTPGPHVCSDLRPLMGSRQWLELPLDGLWGSARRDSCPSRNRALALWFKGAASTQPCWEPLTSLSVNCANASCRRGRQETSPSLGKLPWPGAQPTSCQEAKGLRGLWFGQELLFERWSCLSPDFRQEAAVGTGIFRGHRTPYPGDLRLVCRKGLKS